jgi:enoyl-CoA hydratase
MTETAEPILLVERDGPVAILTLNRAKQLNALSTGLRREIVSNVRHLGQAGDVRVMILAST